MSEHRTALPRVAVVQDGARLHYAVPIALQRAGALDRVYTDWYAAHFIERLASALLLPVGGRRIRRMRERVAAELDARRVRSKPSLAMLQLRRARFETEADFFAMVRRQTARWILGQGFGTANALFGFVRNIDPAVCEAARSRGLKVVVDQMIAPFNIERAEAAKQEKRFPGWTTESSDTAALDDLAGVERQTWENADHITCGSEYVKAGLIDCGVCAANISVLPYPLDALTIPPIDRRGRSGPVTVGFVGTVGIRKGVPYLLELARRFDPRQVRFVLIGPVSIRSDVLDQHRGPAEIVGPVPRSEIPAWLQKFDIFCLPSTCEGSAGSTSEAMAAGLPVVVSPNAGAPITHGVQGMVAPYDDLDALQQCIAALATDEHRRHEMGQAARRRVEAFNLDDYGRDLISLFASIGPSSGPTSSIGSA